MYHLKLFLWGFSIYHGLPKYLVSDKNNRSDNWSTVGKRRGRYSDMDDNIESKSKKLDEEKEIKGLF